jgi:hypothetical protein
VLPVAHLKGRDGLLSFGEFVQRLPGVCRLGAQLTRTWGSLELEQLLLLVLQGAVGRCQRGGGWLASEDLQVMEAGAEAFDVEHGAGVPHCLDFMTIGIGWAHEDLDGAHPARGKQRAGGELRVLCVEEHLIPHSKPCLPPVLVKLCLALGPSFLLQLPNLLRH